MLLVIDPADDLQLLSTEELRLAAGLASSDSSADTQLAALGLRAAGALAAACNIARAGYDSSLSASSPPLVGAAPLTLRSETLSQTFRLRSETRTLYLARRPVSDITSIAIDSDSVAEYELDIIEGTLLKLSSDSVCNWPCGKVVVVYDAGYATVPDELKGYCSQLVNTYYLSSGDDPNEKRVNIPGVIERERWVDVNADMIVPDDIMKGLLRDGFRKPVYA